jgi:hypothetical protein
VADVDAVHAKAVEQDFDIVYPLRDEEWGVQRFLLREPSGTLVNVVSHDSDSPHGWQITLRLETGARGAAAGSISLAEDGPTRAFGSRDERSRLTRLVPG